MQKMISKHFLAILHHLKQFCYKDMFLTGFITFKHCKYVVWIVPLKKTPEANDYFCSTYLEKLRSESGQPERPTIPEFPDLRIQSGQEKRSADWRLGEWSWERHRKTEEIPKPWLPTILEQMTWEREIIKYHSCMCNGQ